MDKNSLTIAICTFNRGEFLDICLQSLLAQLTPHKNIDVLIVDNNCTDNTKAVVEKHQKTTATLRYTRCAEQGLGYARNHALNNSNAQWLSFLDDDAYPEKDWLEQNIKIMQSAKYDAWGGVYLAWFKDGKKPWFKPEYETNALRMPKTERQLLKSDPYFSGGNCTFDRLKLLNAGGFPVELGMNGNKAAYGEEVSAQRNFAIAGGILGFAPHLIIHHYTPMKKQSISWIWHRHYVIGRDFWDIFGKVPNNKNVRFYLRASTQKALSITKTSLCAFWSNKADHTLKNVLYDLAIWASVLGKLIGATKRRLSSEAI